MPRSPARRTPRGRAPLPVARLDYCTYFDHNYLAKGLALYRSLEEHGGSFRLFVLCLSKECRAALDELALPEVVLLSLEELEAFDPEFRATRPTRSTVEYYFTSTAPLLRFVFARHLDVRLLTYLDADLVFFSSPQPIFKELADASIGIVAHRFPERLRHLERYGIYNVGWVSIRRGRAGFRCLKYWRKRCLEWCYDREEQGKFADQKYLDDWPERFGGVRVLRHPGADLAPWNVDSHQLSKGRKGLLVDGKRLIFFHAHRFDFDSQEGWECNFEDFGSRPDALLVEEVLEPYARRLDRASSELGAIGGAAGGEGRAATIRERSLVGLRRALRESEADRAARLEEIRRRDARLTELESEIADLRAQLLGSESDRAARLQEIRARDARLAETETSLTALRAELQGVERDRTARLREIRARDARLAETETSLTALRAELQGVERDRAARLQEIRVRDARLVEVEASLAAIRAELQGVERDRAARLLEIRARDARLAESESTLATLRAELQQVREDRLARLREIRVRDVRLSEREASLAALQTELRAVEADRAARLEVIQRLDRALREAEADRADRLVLAEHLGRELNDETARRAALAERISVLQSDLARADDERLALGESIVRLEGRRERLEEELAAAGERIRALADRLSGSEVDRAARLAALEAVSRELADMRVSLSWRLTLPLRTVGSMLRRR